MRNRKRNLNEWMDIITECRQSGMSDAAWCELNGVSVNCFYNAVSRLRKKACEIPESKGKACVLDMTCTKQDVVEVSITPDIIQSKTLPSEEMSSMYLDNSHTIEITVNGMSIKLNNSVSPVLLERIMYSLRAPLC